jgi:hypothetical protein
MRLVLDEKTAAGRIGLELLVRQDLAAARRRGDVLEVERLQECERELTARLVGEVTAPRWNFSVNVFGVNRPAGRTSSRLLSVRGRLETYPRPKRPGRQQG